MTDDLFKRYSKQIFIEEIGVEGQRKIMASKVLVIGAGGLGSPVIQYLAAAGIGTLAVADFDRVELHNLNRQIIHFESQVGNLKTDSAAQYVAALNSHIKFVPIHQKITPENVDELFKDYDVIVDGSDNFSTRYTINDACVNLSKPLVYGSIFSFEGQVAVFNFRGSKNLRDIFPQMPSEDMPDCERHGVLGALPGLVGSLMSMQVLKIISGLTVDINQLLIIDTLGWTFSKVSF